MVLLGPPGAGKGTQAEAFTARQGVPHVSTGDILRDAVARRTEEGLKAQRLMEQGELVPDSLVASMVEARLREKDCGEGFVLDGFPRNVEQAEMLESILGRTGRTLASVVAIEVPEEEVVARLGGRRVCGSCGRNFHVRFQPPRAEGRCDGCGGTLVARKDDALDVIRERLAVYQRQTEPLLRLYGEQSLLRRVSGAGNPEEVAERILRSVGMV
jgi:adenylate kinase